MDPLASSIITFLALLLLTAILVAGAACVIAWTATENLRRYLNQPAGDHELVRYAHRAAERLQQLAADNEQAAA